MVKICQGFLTQEELRKRIISGHVRTSYYKTDLFVKSRSKYFLMQTHLREDFFNTEASYALVTHFKKTRGQKSLHQRLDAHLSMHSVS